MKEKIKNNLIKNAEHYTIEQLRKTRNILIIIGIVFIITLDLTCMFIGILLLCLSYLFNKSLKFKNNTITKSLIHENDNYIPTSVYDIIYLTRKSNTYPQNYVVFDTETTGLDCKNDKIIEISAIKYVNNQKVDEFSELVNPRRTLDPFIVELTGIQQADIETKPTIDKILPNFFEFIEDYTLVAHNIEFDIDMLACECYRNHISMCQNKLIDTVSLAKKIIPKETIKNYKLKTIKKYLKLNNNSHRALDDCATCAKIYQLYLDKRKK